MDFLLVGDSAAMVVHGYCTTLPITLDEIILHARAVARGAVTPLLVADLPFGSYELGPAQAVASAVRLVKEGAVDAVKLEGGDPQRAATAQAVVDAGVAVLGHAGLLPQRVSALGGFRAMGASAAEGEKVFDAALRLQDAGCFGLVLECIPEPLARSITATLDIPTVGIGCGPGTSGQIIVYHDVIGMCEHPHYASVTPRFVKKYAQVGSVIADALEKYKEEVATSQFPSEEFSPYKMKTAQREKLAETLHKRGFGAAAEQLAGGDGPSTAAADGG